MQDAGQVADIPVTAGSVRWERPTARSFWNALADPEREALAAAGVEEFFRAGAVLCREGADTSQVMIIDSGWVKVSVRDTNGGENILAVRGQGDVVGERAALTTGVRSATVTALDEVSAMVVPAERFAEFLRGHPRAADVLERQVTERREEDRARLFPAERAGAERRLAWLLLDLAQRRGGYQHTSTAAFTLPMSQQELADWAGTSPDAVGRFLRSWRDRGIIARTERSRRLTVIDLDGLAALCDVAPPDTRADRAPNGSQAAAAEAATLPRHEARWQQDWREPLNCSIVFTDVAGFSDPVRNDGDRGVVRAAMYEILRSCFDAAGVSWAGCYREDRGDGAVIVVPPTISTQRLIDPLMAELAGRLRQYNRRASEVVRIQLRVALHVGPVGRDSEGLTGQAVIAAARIVDAPVIKARLAAEQADLIFAASDYVYDQVVRNCGGQVDPVAFEHLQCQVKETHVSAWAHLTGRVAPPRGLSLVPPPAPAAAPGPLPVAAPLGNLPREVRGRQGLIAELRRALRPYPRRASRAFVIAGMGGLGKSTVALAAARMARERGYRVWWVRAADSALLTSGMLEVLRELGAPESVTAPVREGARTAPERAWEFLNRDHGAGRRWLLVFDGADNPAVLAGAEADTPADGTGRLRADPAGIVIVTTRTRDPQVWGTRVTLRELKPLDDEAGAEVLRDLAPEVTDPGGHEARELSRRLGGLPLALPCFAPATPIPAWLLQLPPLADLLAGPGHAGQDNGAERRGLRAGLQGLSRTGLIDISATGSPAGVHAVTVHPVVADANRIRLAASADAERRAVQETVVALFEAATAGLDPVRPGDWPTWRRLRAHMNAAIDLLADDLDPAVLARLLTVSAVGTEALLGAGRLAAAGKLAQASVAAAAFLPPDDPAALTTRGYLARTLVRRGRSGDAETIYRELLAERIRVQGEDHLATLATRHDLAAALGVQGRFGDAEELYRRLLVDNDRLRGPDHRETLAARYNLARMIGLRGRYADAEELCYQVLRDRRQLLSEDHPDNLSTRHRLARMLSLQGRYADAEPMFRQVLAARRRVLGEDHPDTLSTEHRLGWLIGRQGRHSEAIDIVNQVLGGRRNVLGDEHPDTLAP